MMQGLNKIGPNRPGKQVVLPLTKSFEIAVKGIKVRFFRTLITTFSLILAISFYQYIRTNTIIVSDLFTIGDKATIQRLLIQGYDQPEPGAVHTITPKERWILFLSLLVCVVGIVNTQLMAVTDRFREIGTMKCLGALDRFIVRLFLIEAAIQGLIGSMIGSAAGSALAILSAYFKFGLIIFEHLNMGLILISMGTAMGLGSLLSILGVLYPALVAARMQPVDAMKGKD